VRVNVLAEVVYRPDNYVLKFSLKNILPYCIYKRFNEIEVPITPLEFEFLRYFFERNLEYVEKILRRIKNQEIELLDIFLEQLPKELKKEIREITKSKNVGH